MCKYDIVTWLCDYVLERGGHDSRAGGDERKKKDQEDEEETPPPLPPRQRPEVTDEPFPKKSRTNNHGMLQTKHFSEKKTHRKKLTQALLWPWSEIGKSGPR